ncbi:MAG: hypothetical protein WB992_18855 [Bryobacteraceae bacterium]
MSRTRRTALFTLLVPAILGAQNPDQQEPARRLPVPPDEDDDKKLPDGKSQKNAIAKEEHERALKDADDLITVAQQLRDELQKAGNYIVPVSSVKKTEEIERLARRIRGRLKD